MSGVSGGALRGALCACVLVTGNWKEEANNYLKHASGCNMLPSCSFFFFNVCPSGPMHIVCTGFCSWDVSAAVKHLTQKLSHFSVWIKSRWKLIIVFKCAVPPDNILIKSGLQCLCEMDLLPEQAPGSTYQCVSCTKTCPHLSLVDFFNWCSFSV